MAQQYTTENRLRNVNSHIGEINNKMFGKLLGLFSKDILEDMEKDNPEIFEGLKADRRSIVNKEVNKNVQVFIRERFLHIIDGVF